MIFRKPEDATIDFVRSSSVHRFGDWIISLKFFGSLDNARLVFLFAHNNLHVFHMNENVRTNVRCQEKCLLYPFPRKLYKFLIHRSQTFP